MGDEMSSSVKPDTGLAPPPPPVLDVQDVNQYYGGSHILRGVSLQARLGKVTVLLGRNGVGKTTLLKSLMGLVPIRSGSISFDGRAIQGATPFARARAGIGFVPQGREIFARLTVEENLRMGLAYKSASTPIDPELYELFPGAQADAAAPWRRLVGRPAAAAGDRPGAGGTPEAADPGRADRRHTAQHHQGHRARHPHAGRARHDGASCWSSSITTSRRNWPTTTW